jgi:bifunctional ADP-heptose synthase (sugar kinase/adenylyltransferase)
MCDEAIDDASGDEMPQRALGNKGWEVVDVAEAGEAAVAVFWIAVAEDHIAEGGVGQGVHEGGVVGGDEGAEMTPIGNITNIGQQLLRPAGVDAVVEFFDDDDGVSY